MSAEGGALDDMSQLSGIPDSRTPVHPRGPGSRRHARVYRHVMTCEKMWGRRLGPVPHRKVHVRTSYVETHSTTLGEQRPSPAPLAPDRYTAANLK
ncbi:hypothetical protein VFPFJ_09054 [Purpureocillium lilacinum]|uniref:Uncharacterized protein n=1 Tax=Purpureocillium lilacinum TaxID=33203 RepID=A0A179H197_PURLI|nr:hypothetical protein VFPFJ_09054 [Purpureocillium lilacinum]OAQ83251.1 hypothetical protein VFPFJ_09054 [Purpureocillium lilacinum]